MSRLTLHHPESPTDGPEQVAKESEPTCSGPLLIDIADLSSLLSRSVPSLHRDDAAGRLPAAVRIGGSKRWRYDEIAAWVRHGCPLRAQWSRIWESIQQQNGRR